MEMAQYQLEDWMTFSQASSILSLQASSLTASEFDTLRDEIANTLHIYTIWQLLPFKYCIYLLEI